LSKAENFSKKPNPPLSFKCYFFGIPLNGKALLKNPVGIKFAILRVIRKYSNYWAYLTSRKGAKT